MPTCHPYCISTLSFALALDLLSQLRINIALASRGLRHAGPYLWNSLLPPHPRSMESYAAFKFNLRSHQFFDESMDTNVYICQKQTVT